MASADPSKTHRGQAIRPGAVLRAMGASDKAITPVFDDVATIAASHGSAIRPSGGPDSPQLNVREQGDQVTQIIVKCTCGREISIDCDYGDANR